MRVLRRSERVEIDMRRWRAGSSASGRRALRARQSDAERALWWHLGARQLGVKFRRQHSVGPYILDFYCPEARLAVEVDGDGHATAQQLAYDEQRTANLASLGIRLVRFSNLQVLTEAECVLGEIARTLTLPSPAAAGEGSH